MANFLTWMDVCQSLPYMWPVCNWCFTETSAAWCVLNYLEVKQLEYQLSVWHKFSAWPLARQPDLWIGGCGTNFLSKELWDLWMRGGMWKDKAEYNCTCSNCTEAWFPRDRGTLIEMSFVIWGKCKPLFCVSCSLTLPIHSQLLQVQWNWPSETAH